jgi:hypothetical protein
MSAVKQLTREEAIAFAEGGQWKLMSAREIALMHLEQEFLCFPAPVLLKATGEALGRPVQMVEFAWPDKLRDELEGKIPAPTLGDIIERINSLRRKKDLPPAEIITVGVPKA